MKRCVNVDSRIQFYNGQVHMGLPQEQLKDDTAPMRSTRGRMPSGKPNPVDVHVGARVRLRRTLLGMSQEKLGEAIGLTFQQVQKYERGANRIGASRLWDLSRVLDCPMSFFFEEMDDETAQSSPRNLSGDSRDLEPRDNDPMTKRETLELVRAYYRINDYHVRRRIYELAKSLATTEEPVEA
jgi:transcriptional regulator with XRE-family HTH domain